MADYYGIPIPGDTQVTIQSRGSKEGRVGINKGIDSGVGRNREEQVSESYTREARPIRAFNDTLDSLLREEQVIDLTSNPEAELIQKMPMQTEVEMRISPAVDIGNLLGRFFSDPFWSIGQK